MSGAGRFYLSFKVATWLVVALGYLAVWISGMVGAAAAALMAISLVASWPERRWPPLTERHWRVAALGFIAWLLLAWSLRLASGLELASQLLIFLQVQRLATRRENRDYAWLYLIALLQVLLGCVLTVAPAFALVLLTFLMAMTWALLLFQLKQGMDQAREAEQPPLPQGTTAERLRGFLLGDDAPADPPALPPALLYAHARGLLSGGFVVVTTAVTLGMLAATLAIFLVAPRLDLSFFGPDTGDPTHLAGFSDQVSLGDLGEILLGRGKVMRVRMRGPLIDAGASLPLYWRGTALDHFDGSRWSLSRDQRQIFHEQGTFLNPRTPPVSNVIQEITLEPLDTDVIFALSQAQAFQVQTSMMYRTSTGGFQVERSRARLGYTVWSWVEQPDAQALREAGEAYPDAMREVYLQLPEAVSPKVAALAAEITRGQPTPYDAARAIEGWLRAEFTYTLDPQSTGPAPLEDFIFRTRAGHCEYFASAMVILARSAGIPSRIVNGFAGGVYNKLGGYWVVAQNDAHTWVEVFFPREGWVRFDPTPAAIIQGFGGTDGTVSMYLDYLESLWYFYVLDYGLQIQLDVARDLMRSWGISMEPEHSQRRRRRRDRDRDREEPDGLKIGRLALQGVVAVALGGLILSLALRLRRRRQRLRGEGAGFAGPAADVRRYLVARRRLERQLDPLGLARAPSETPLERARRAQGVSRALGAALTAVEEDYCHLRFGGRPVTPEHRARVDAARATVRRVGAPGTPPG